MLGGVSLGAATWVASHNMPAAQSKAIQRLRKRLEKPNMRGFIARPAYSVVKIAIIFGDVRSVTAGGAESRQKA